jgi:hypothetical protein
MHFNLLNALFLGDLIAMFKQNGWQVIDSQTLVRSISEPEILPERAAVLTFDDGYRSVLTIAAPILAKYELPAVVFCCSAPNEERRLHWWDHVAASEGEEAIEGWKDRPYEDWLASCALRAPVANDAVVFGVQPRRLEAPRVDGVEDDAGAIDVVEHPGQRVPEEPAVHALLEHLGEALGEQHNRLPTGQTLDTLSDELDRRQRADTSHRPAESVDLFRGRWIAPMRVSH